VLVDTSVWVDHLRRTNPRLRELLQATQVWTHAFVVGELACGTLARRVEILRSLAALPHAPLVEHAEVLAFVERYRLYGRGIGWVDMNLLAAARVARVPFWTQDKKLARIANELNLTPTAN
jgi:predicted nucleic acid-binding protein